MAMNSTANGQTLPDAAGLTTQYGCGPVVLFTSVTTSTLIRSGHTRGISMRVAGSGMLLHPWPIKHVSSHPGLAFWYEAGRFDMGSQGWKTHQSSSIATFFPTQVGATALELSFDENGKARFRLMLGSF